MGNAQRDSNYVTTLIAVSNADGTTPVTLYADPTTHRLLVSATAGAFDDLSDVVITTAEQGDVIYFNGTNWVNLAHGTNVQYLKSGGHGANPSWDTPTVSITGGDTQVTFFDGANTPAGDAGMTYNKTTDTLTLAGNLLCEDIGLEDSNASHRLIITTTSDLTADRNLTLVPGDAARTITISGDATISQDYSATGNPQFATLTLNNTGLHLLDTNASHDLILAPGSDLTADHTLTITTGDADRTLSLAANLTIPADPNADKILFWDDSAGATAYLGAGNSIAITDVTIDTIQDIRTTANPQFATIELGHASDTTIARSGAGTVTIEGNTVVVNTASPTLGTITTTGSIELGHASDTTLARASAGVVSIEGNNVVVNTASPTLGTITTTGNIELGHASDTTIARVSAGVVSIEGVNVLTVAGGTLTGSITLGENTGVALDPAGSADGKWSGITVAGTAGYTAASGAFGDLVYLAAADSRWEQADADAASTSGDVMLGMMLTDAPTDGSACVILLIGNIRADAKFPALTISAQVYASTTAGAIQVAQPSGTDDVIRVVGRALTADEIFFNPSNDYITHT